MHFGIEHINTTENPRRKVFAIIEQQINPGTNKKNGRLGMELWRILFFDVLRPNLNGGYDSLVEMANYHKTKRFMLGHSSFDDDYEYKLQAMNDDVALLTPKFLNEINTDVVDGRHNLIKK